MVVEAAPELRSEARPLAQEAKELSLLKEHHIDVLNDRCWNDNVEFFPGIELVRPAYIQFFLFFAVLDSILIFVHTDGINLEGFT